MRHRCELCEREFSNIGRLQVHLEKIHSVDIEEFFLKGTDAPLCPICNSPRKFASLSIGYYDTCGNKSCSSSLANKVGKEKHIQACKSRNSKWKNEILHNGKTKQQEIIDKGQTKRNQKSKETGQKISKSLKENQSQIKEAFVSKFGVDNPMKNPEVVKNFRYRYMQKTGYSWITQNPTVQQKIRNTMLKKYGVDNYSKTSECWDKRSHQDKINTIERIKSFFSDHALEFIDNIDELYETEKTTITFRCINCNTIYKKCWNDIQQWWSCKKCSDHVSGPEQNISLFLNDCNISFEQGNRNIIKNDITDNYLELDFYIPSRNIAIEVDGLFWHSSANLLNDNYHLYKTDKCAESGIQLIHIFEDELILKQDIVYSVLRSKLGLLTKKIYARKCIVQEIPSIQCNEFLNKNHLQGSDSSPIKLGLFYNEELVSVMTFSKSSISKGMTPKENCWELNRFCSKLNTIVIGAMSKLLSYFKRNNSWEQIYSFADRRWSNGNSYLECGFQLDYITKPNYWYINLSKTLKRYHRFKFRKNMLTEMKHFSQSLTEKEIMELEGYSRIYDCGSYKFIMTK